MNVNNNTNHDYASSVLHKLRLAGASNSKIIATLCNNYNDAMEIIRQLLMQQPLAIMRPYEKPIEFLNPLTDKQKELIFGVTTEYLTVAQIKEKYNIDL